MVRLSAGSAGIRVMTNECADKAYQENSDCHSHPDLLGCGYGRKSLPYRHLAL